MTAGNLIIIGLDANGNVRTGPVNAMLGSIEAWSKYILEHPGIRTLNRRIGSFAFSPLK
jgi:hypothetical protein